MKPKIYRYLYIIILFFFSSFISYKFLYNFTEKYFFDKVFYKKSFAHGYYGYKAQSIQEWSFIYKGFNYDNRLDDYFTLFGYEIKKNIINKFVNIFSNKKDNSNYYKVVLIGDSLFFGTGLRKTQTLSFFLEKELNKYLKTKVYNLSFEGDDLIDNYLKYLLAEQKIKPNLYIISLVDNDLAFDNLNRYPGKEKLFQDINKQCNSKNTFLLDEHPIPDDLNNYIIDVINESFNEKYNNVCLLDQISKRFESTNIILVTYGCPNVSEKENVLYKYKSYFSNSINSVDICNLSRNSVSKMEGHPSKETNQMLAKIIREKIINFYDFKVFKNGLFYLK